MEGCGFVIPKYRLLVLGKKLDQDTIKGCEYWHFFLVGEENFDLFGGKKQNFWGINDFIFGKVEFIRGANVSYTFNLFPVEIICS